MGTVLVSSMLLGTALNTGILQQLKQVHWRAPESTAPSELITYHLVVAKIMNKKEPFQTYAFSLGC
jgi:hypothetical protein